MATPVLVPISEYLHTTYRPDCDYVDGELKERNVGEKPHGGLQGLLYGLFMGQRKAWGLTPYLEQRVQTSAAHYRIPDVCVIRPVAGEYIVRTPPVICIEVLSKDDTLAGIRERVDDFLAMGVEHVWVFDPLGHVAWRATSFRVRGGRGRAGDSRDSGADCAGGAVWRAGGFAGGALVGLRLCGVRQQRRKAGSSASLRNDNKGRSEKQILPLCGRMTDRSKGEKQVPPLRFGMTIASLRNDKCCASG